MGEKKSERKKNNTKKIVKKERERRTGEFVICDRMVSKMISESCNWKVRLFQGISWPIVLMSRRHTSPT